MALTDEDLLDFPEDDNSNHRWVAVALCALCVCARAALPRCLINSTLLLHKYLAPWPLSACLHLLGLVLHALRALFHLATARPPRPPLFSLGAPGASRCSRRRAHLSSPHAHRSARLRASAGISARAPRSTIIAETAAARSAAARAIPEPGAQQ